MKYAKAILAAVFGLSPAVVVGILALVGVHVDETTVTALVGVLSPVLATLGVAVGPANKALETGSEGQDEAPELEGPAQIQALWAQHHASTDPATLNPQ
ncbi:hypothetical protein [Amycolatopsis sp. NPDC051903]|uniref:hypothetical protein n=1 Tax=Amycolatopsis sp. NPDC051903 TaxID=3363936 RepID=UPI00378EFDF0